MFSEKYKFMIEELLKRLREHRNEFNLNCVDFEELFPYDQFAEVNTEVKNIVKNLEEEFNYEMSECQCSAAIVALIKDDNLAT